MLLQPRVKWDSPVGICISTRRKNLSSSSPVDDGDCCADLGRRLSSLRLLNYIGGQEPNVPGGGATLSPAVSTSEISTPDSGVNYQVSRGKWQNATKSAILSTTKDDYAEEGDGGEEEGCDGGGGVFFEEYPSGKTTVIASL